MNKDLTISNVERQNVLNNRIALNAIAERFDLPKMFFEGEYRFTKSMVANFYEVDERTIERYVERYMEELSQNGYQLLKGKKLKEFKLHFAHDINVGSKTTQLGVFNFRAFLNLGMLLTESEKAKFVRNQILDIVISTINSKTGGGTKYINRRDVNYLPIAIAEENYRKKFTSAIHDYVVGHDTIKYTQITDFVYQAVFKERAREYRELLELKPSESIKRTLYAEVLLVISSLENGVAHAIEDISKIHFRPLSIEEVKGIVEKFTDQPALIPYLIDARTKMASRDLGFRNVFHKNLSEYLISVSPEDFERFIGKDSIDFDSILEANIDVLKRLKQAENE